jgi:hypothetical protein
MFEVECKYLLTQNGLHFLPDDYHSGFKCTLQVAFEPVAYYPAEPDIGAGDDFDARIARITMLDDDASCGCYEKLLTSQSRENAEKFLDACHRDAMWETAGEEVRDQVRHEDRIAA